MLRNVGIALALCLLAGLVLFLVTDRVLWLVAGLAVWLLISIWVGARGDRRE
ncbi:MULTISPECIES: hypothetical protein [Microbacterium]|uniref:hypothetical protein n=1 Tax=Microbacterium TaxID=33882 RepID=UPI001431CC88|nr:MULTISPECIES: hypothetical protein [Microbacterium]MCK6067531.1 hypothetical protein [Microbacterium sp. EYE_512]